jgi:ketosteroid isomerase-like protein
MRRHALILILACAVPVLVRTQIDVQAIQRMAATERAFAAATAEIGVRDGFLTFFAEDSIQLLPGASGSAASLVPAKDDLRKRPLAQLPFTSRLLWEPFTGHVSEDGSLGWLTGGSATIDLSSRNVLRQGAYFSVWKRQPDGLWRVWLDDGIQLPEVWRHASPFRAAPPPDAAPPDWPENTTIESAERAIARGGAPWKRALAAGVRIHRGGRMPLVGRDAALEWADQTWTDVTFTLLRMEVAASGDLGVALGGYDATAIADGRGGGAGGAVREHGTWVRVWKRDVAGYWRVVFETSKTA